jgi:hypothetical protein
MDIFEAVSSTPDCDTAGILKFNDRTGLVRAKVKGTNIRSHATKGRGYLQMVIISALYLVDLYVFIWFTLLSL